MAMAAGMNPMNIINCMYKAVKVVLEDLAAKATVISNTSTVRSIASLIESTAVSPRSPTESRSLAVREEIDIKPLTPELLQRISSHGRSREAELGLECKEAAVRCQNATRALQDAIEMSRTVGPSLRVRRGRRLKRRRLDQERQGEDCSTWIQSVTAVEKKVVSTEERTAEKATTTEHDTKALQYIGVAASKYQRDDQTRSDADQDVQSEVFDVCKKTVSIYIELDELNDQFVERRRRSRTIRRKNCQTQPGVNFTTT